MSESKNLNEIEKSILDAIGKIKYGAVEVLIHDSKVVQVECSEKVRFDNNKK
jgi:hypothetical protein